MPDLMDSGNAVAGASRVSGINKGIELLTSTLHSLIGNALCRLRRPLSGRSNTYRRVRVSGAVAVVRPPRSYYVMLDTYAVILIIATFT
jgi:hypothetical protein